MMFGSPCEDYEVNPVLTKAMDRILMLHADHEQNASTSTVRLAGSTGANPFACIASGIAALWGPAHGGANEAVLNMLDEIGSEKNIDKYVAKAKDKDDPFRLMGFGHRVYKNYDPRAKIMQETCREVLEELGTEDNPAAAHGPASREDRPGRRLFRQQAALPQRGLLLGHHFQSHGYPHRHVHRAVRHRENPRLDRAVGTKWSPAATRSAGRGSCTPDPGSGTTWRWRIGSDATSAYDGLLWEADFWLCDRP